MLFAAPDAAICGPVVGSKTPVPGCDPAKLSTSYNDRFHDNVMGVAPNSSVQPNGTDWWWDALATTTGNCWWGNQAAPGFRITSSPTSLPDCAGGTNPSASVGTGSSNEAELAQCLGAVEAGGYDPSKCPWFVTPPKPSSSAPGPVPGAGLVPGLGLPGRT